MISEDDKRFYELSAKQSKHNLSQRRLDKSPDRIYDRVNDLRSDRRPLLEIEAKYELSFLFKAFREEK